MGIAMMGRAAAPSEEESNMATTTTGDVDEEGDFDEWVLLDDDASERSSLYGDGDLDLVLAPGGMDSERTSNCASPRSTVDSLGWKLAPPPCFSTALPARGQNKYKHVKHRNPNLLKSLPSAPAAATNRMEVSLLSNMLIEHPNLAVFKKRQTGPGRVLALRQKSVDLADKLTSIVEQQFKTADKIAEDLENQEPKKLMQVIESKSNPAYVVTGIDVCAERPVAAALLAQRLEIKSIDNSAATMGKRRPKRQHFTLYDANVFNNGRGKQRKDQRPAH